MPVMHELSLCLLLYALGDTPGVQPPLSEWCFDAWTELEDEDLVSGLRDATERMRPDLDLCSWRRVFWLDGGEVHTAGLTISFAPRPPPDDE